MVVSSKTANIWAMIAFFGVLVVGGTALALSPSVDHPPATTTVTKSASPATRTSEKSVVVNRTGKKLTKTTTTKTSTAGATPQATDTTTVDSERSFFERMLGGTGVVFLQISVILLAAFLAGAALQRVLLGKFGGLKLGALEISEIATASDEAIASLSAAIAALDAKAAMIQSDAAKTRTRLEKVRTESRTEDLETTQNLKRVASRLRAVERKMDQAQ